VQGAKLVQIKCKFHQAQVLGAMVQCAYMYALALCTTALTNRKPINQNHRRKLYKAALAVQIVFFIAEIIHRAL